MQSEIRISSQPTAADAYNLVVESSHDENPGREIAAPRTVDLPTTEVVVGFERRWIPSR
jgi:hypothetical protein